MYTKTEYERVYKYEAHFSTMFIFLFRPLFCLIIYTKYILLSVHLCGIDVITIYDTLLSLYSL